MTVVEQIAIGDKDALGVVLAQFEALVDPHRLAIISYLVSAPGELTTSELQRRLSQAGMGVSQSTVSVHLGVLLNAGMVSRRPDGCFAYWTVDELAWGLSLQAFLAELAGQV